MFTKEGKPCNGKCPLLQRLFYAKNSSLILVILDLEGRVELINDVLKDKLDIKYPQDILGTYWLDNFIPKDERQVVMEIFNETASSKKSNFINHVRNPNGLVEILVAWDNFSFNNSICCIGMDITNIEKLSVRTSDQTDIEFMFTGLSRNINRLKDVREKYSNNCIESH